MAATSSRASGTRFVSPIVVSTAMAGATHPANVGSAASTTLRSGRACIARLLSGGGAFTGRRLSPASCATGRDDDQRHHGRHQEEELESRALPRRVEADPVQR